MSRPSRVLIVGGVAGGASCAARLRRLCEEPEIVLFDRGPYVSFANCGLPYHVGDVIRDESKLLVASSELFRSRFNIEVRTEHEVHTIDRSARAIEVEDLKTGRRSREPYDALVLSPGARPFRPPIEGIDEPGIFAIRTIPDTRRVRAWIEERGARRAVVVGGGFIGLEMAENLAHRDLAVSLVEAAPQVMPPLDPELASVVAARLAEASVALHLGQAVTGFRRTADDALVVHTERGTEIETDLVILALGVVPETKLAEQAGLALGNRGIRVDASMRTDDPHIWAVGDAVEVPDFVTGRPTNVPLAGPAQRQGRIAADAICGRPSRFRGVQATAVCGAFGLTLATTGAHEKGLVREGVDRFEKVYLHPGHHVGYYPGAQPIHLKLLFDPDDGRVLGAQAVGEAGVEKRIDVITTTIQHGGTVFDLEEAELCYAPQYGAAKDPVNLAGMIAANALRGDAPVAHWEELGAFEGIVLDVRERDEFERGHVDGAMHLPLSELRERLDELPRDRPIRVYCVVGQRAYYATRLLRQHGFEVHNLSGGLRTRDHVADARREPDDSGSGGALP